MTVANIRLVAGREVREGLRSKTFIIVTALMAVLAVLAIIVPVVISNSSRSRTIVGVVGGLDTPIRAVILQVAATSNLKLEFRDLDDRGAAAAAVRAGRVKVAVVDGRELLVRRAVMPEDISREARLVTTMSILLAITDTGPLPVNALEPAGARAAGAADRFTGYAGVLAIFMFLLYYGIWVCAGVTDEKVNRLVEVVLATVRPIELMAGKVIGIGVVAMTQAATIGVVAFATAWLTGSDLVRQISARMALAALLWFILGYALYGLAYAAIGATVARPEEARSAPMPLGIPLIVGYVVPIGALSTGQDSALLTALSYFPPTAPFGMVMRTALGTVRGWEVALAAALMVIAIAGVAAISGRIYSNSILRTGKRVGIIAALRSPA